MPTAVPNEPNHPLLHFHVIHCGSAFRSMLSLRAVGFCRGGDYSPVHGGHSLAEHESQQCRTTAAGEKPLMIPKWIRTKSMLVCAFACSAHGMFGAGRCSDALAQRSCATCKCLRQQSDQKPPSGGRYCSAGREHRALVLFAASERAKLDVSTPVLPLSLAKVFLAASWWDHNEPDLKFESLHGSENAVNPAYRESVNVHEILVGGSDSAGRQMAIALRKAVGTEVVLADLRRYGFNRGNESFWADVDPQWRKQLAPRPPTHP